MNYFRIISFFIIFILITNVSTVANNTSVKNIINKKISLEDGKKIRFTQFKSTSFIIKAPPSVDFTFTNNNSCSGTSIQFTSTVSGNGPFKYAWDFGDGNNSTAKNPTHKYTSFGCGTETFNVSLIVTDADTLQTVKNNTIIVKQQPDISFFDNDAEIGEEDFSNCSDASIENPNYSITVENNSPSKGCIDSYSIDWGDGSNETNATFPIDHEYSQLGAFEMVITAQGSNNCDNSILYIVKNQTNPSGGIISPGTTTDLCAPTDELEFAISGWVTNSPGTQYLVNYGDGSEIQITQEEMIASKYYNTADPASSGNFLIPHSYAKTSCPDASFTVNLMIINACSETPAAVGNITVITKPEPDFNTSATCVNSSILFTNKTINGSGKNCTSKANFTWDFGDGSPIVEQNNTLPLDVSHIYTTSGVYNVTLTAINNTICGENSITKPITISDPPTATISGEANICIGDTPPSVTFTGANGAAPYTFTYKINNGENQTVSTSAGNNSATIEAPTNVAGTFAYSLISVSASSCSQSQTGTAEIIVNSAPTASILGTDSVCINEPPPLITFTGKNGTAPYTFTYNINGGPNQTITSETGDTVTIKVATNSGGIFKYNLLDVQDAGSNLCSLAPSGFATITINDQLPEPLILDNFEFCNGETIPLISFSNTVPGTTYTWTNSNTSIGLVSSGSGNIEAFTAINNSSAPITSSITVIASANGCNGASQTFTITVNPAASVIFSQANQTICSGESTTEVLLSSSTAGVDLSWTTEQPIGISEVIQLSGTNNIQVQSLTNTTNVPITLTYRAKATLTGATTCDGVENNYTITINPKPLIFNNLTDTICSGTSFSISPQDGEGNIIPAGTNYIWSEPIISPSGAIVGTNAQNTPQPVISQTLINTTSAVASATYSVTPITNGCTGSPFTLNISVIPSSSIAPISDFSLCNKETNAEIIFGNNQEGTIYKWSSNNVDIGMANSSGINIIPAFTAINTGTSPLSAIITVIPASDIGNSNCVGTPVQFSITVNPTAQVDNLNNLNLCNGQDISVNFATENTGGTTTYEWINNNPTVGLEASGNGDISFNTSNSTDSTLTAEITVIPTFSNKGYSCEGPSQQFSITINPSATVQQPDNQSICSGNFTSEIIFSGNNSDASYNWTINNEFIGLPASGTGNIPEFVAINNDSDSIVAVITVTPNSNGCDGSPSNFTITVYPTALILKQPSSSTVCLGEKPVPLSVIHTNGIKSPIYQWYSNTSNSTIGNTKIDNETNATLIPPSLFTNTMYYYCIISFPSGGCSTLTSEIAKVNVKPNPIVVLNQETISRNQELKFCEGESINIYASGANNYLWNTGTPGDSIIINNVGDYRVIGISQNGCMDTFNFSASYFNLMNYSIQSDKTDVTKEHNQVHFWSENYPNSFYKWDFGDGIPRYGRDQNYEFEITKDGYFDVKLEVINPYGCQEDTTIKISVSVESFPNTFTPNGDGYNDYYLEGWNKEIYNRNGILLYKGEEGWDGNYNGTPVANDTYFVVIYDSTELGAKHKTNYVTVLR